MASFREENAARQTQFRHAALDNGYSPIPNHHKHCYVKKWPEIAISHDRIDNWGRKLVYQATGLRVENGLCAIDMDVDDAAMVERIWVRAVGQFPNLREALIRYGSGAKEMWVCRTDEEFSVVHSTGHVRPGEDPEGEGIPMHRLEAFGGGHARQIGAYGAHTMNASGTGFEVEYRWEDDESPADVRLDALPILPKSTVLTLARIVYDELTEAGWPRVRRTDVGESAVAASYDLTDDMRFDCLDGVTRTFDQLADYVAVDRNPRCSASWLGEAKYVNRTRCMINVDHEGNVSVLELANWVRHLHIKLADRGRTTGAKAQDLGEKMKEAGFTFDFDTYNDAPASFQDKVFDLLENWAWCGERAAQCVPIYRAEERSQPLSNFRMSNLAYAYVTEGPKGGEKKVNPVDAWLNHSAREQVEGYRFMPDKGPGIYYDDREGIRAINSYHAPVFTPVSDEDRDFYVNLWLDFMEHLLPHEEEREWFLNWLAHKKQDPATPGVGVVMCAPEFGVGRGTLFDFVGGIFGQNYVRNVSPDALLGTNSQSQYNDWMARTLIVTTDEILPEGDDGTNVTWRRKKAYEKLKEHVDPRPRRAAITRKGLPNYEDWIHASFLMSTNHRNALPIPKGDRRFAVLQNSSPPLAEAPDLLRRVNTIRSPKLVPEFVTAISDWLLARDLTGFEMQVAPYFEGKEAMQAANATELEQVVDDMLDAVEYDWVPIGDVLDAVDVELSRQNLRDHYPKWRSVAIDRIKSRWAAASKRVYVDAERSKRRVIIARDGLLLRDAQELGPSGRDAELKRRAEAKTGTSAKARALRAGLREV